MVLRLGVFRLPIARRQPETLLPVSGCLRYHSGSLKTGEAKTALGTCFQAAPRREPS
ncbi:hypothetical protein [Kingella oralis]